MSLTPAFTERDPRPPAPTARGLSLEWKLPLVMTGVLAAVLAAMLACTYVILARRAEAIVRDRLTHAVQQLATTAHEALTARAATLRAAADDSALARAIAGDPAAATAARGVLARLLTPRDSLLRAELWDARGHRVAAAGAPGREALIPSAAVAAAASDSVRVGVLRPAPGGARYWIAAPVHAGGGVVGVVAWERAAGGARDVTDRLRELLREEVTLHTRNADESLWVGPSGAPAAAPTDRAYAAGGLVIGRASGDAIAAEMRVAGTPWVMVLESPRRWVAQRPRETVRQLALLSLAFLGVGAAISWPLSRRLTRPLAALAAAAETIARDGARRPPVARARGDEIVRLSTSFAAMAADVAAARRELERRVDDAQSAADGLALVNWQLREAMDEAQRARADAERAREDAEEANRAKSQFLATMSHELRTPLNAIGGYAQLLDLGVYGPLTPDQRDAVTRVERSQAHLLTLINDVLSFARLDAGQVQYAIDDVPLHEALAELEALVAPQVQATRLRFVYAACDPALAVRADRDKLRQIVLNLLANAIKYTPPGGVVAVACEAAATCVRVRVSDTGTGIPAERLGRIFDPFVQGGRALNRPEEGVGLGLTISRDLARGMGGELEVASEVGRGSVFTVVLPRAAAAMPAVAAPRAPLESVATRGARAT